MSHYLYDGEGNRTRRFVDEGDGQLGAGDADITEYAWDHRNRLTKVTERAVFGGLATETVEYAYDAFNQLVGRTHDADGDAATTGDIRHTSYVFDNGQVVLQFDRTGGSGPLTEQDLSHRYLWGPGVDQLLADEQVDWSNQQADGEVLWALGDHLGTVRDLVDSSGTVRKHAAYNAFGRVTGEQHYDASGAAVLSTDPAAVDALFGYTGKLFDQAAGLQNNLNRWYDAEVGGWASEDPIGFAAGDANLSRYVGNEPTAFADVNGLEAAAAVGVGAGMATGGGFAIASPPPIALCVFAGVGGYAVGTGADWLTGGAISDVVGEVIGQGSVAIGWNAPPVAPAMCRSLPLEGPPGGTLQRPGQTREYGEDGYPVTDVDVGHDHGAGDPHAHDWTRPVGGGPPTHKDRGKGRPLKPGDPPVPPSK